MSRVVMPYSPPKYLLEFPDEAFQMKLKAHCAERKITMKDFLLKAASEKMDKEEWGDY